MARIIKRETGLSPRKAEGITFDKGVKAFGDPFAVEWIDKREADGEEQSNLLGMCRVSSCT
jgi:hypothetical protein